MTESESGTANPITTGEAKASAARAATGPTPPRRSYLSLWVIVLTLPVTIVALAIAFEVFGLLVRLGSH